MSTGIDRSGNNHGSRPTVGRNEFSGRFIDLHVTVEKQFHGMRLDLFLTKRFRLSRSRAGKIIATNLTVNDSKPSKSGVRVACGDKIHIRRPAPKEPPVPTNYLVLQEDSEYIAVGKPAGLPVHPTGNFLKNTLTSLLKNRYGSNPAPVPAHRLDRETSGVILMCRTKRAERELKKGFSEGKIKKDYLALVHGRVDKPGKIDFPLGPDANSIIRIKQGVTPEGRPSLTHYRPVKTSDSFSLLEIRPETGRQHQIRAHMEAIGHPVVGDKIYGVSPDIFLTYIENGMTPDMMEKLLLPFHALHAYSITFQHPVTGEITRIDAPPPPYFTDFPFSLEM